MNKHGQSMVEYALIAVLVILGVVIMGPYVLRSVNAHFRLWDDSVQDSFTETLKQAPATDIPTIPINCTCSTTPGACGSSTSACSESQREYDHVCSIQGCDGARSSSCVDDPSCCSGYIAEGCGTFPCPAGGCPTSATTPPPTSNNCYFGYQIQGQQCGSNPGIQCVLNNICPIPVCLGIVSIGATACPNEPQSAATGLTQNTGISYCAAQAGCNTPCEYYCDPGYFYNGTSCTRIFTVALIAPSCPSTPDCNCTTSGNTVTNDCSFSMCAGTGIAITGTTVTANPTGQPTNAPINVNGTDGCQNPGEPGDTCQINTTLGPGGGTCIPCTNNMCGQANGCGGFCPPCSCGDGACDGTEKQAQCAVSYTDCAPSNCPSDCTTPCGPGTKPQTGTGANTCICTIGSYPVAIYNAYSPYGNLLGPWYLCNCGSNQIYDPNLGACRPCNLCINEYSQPIPGTCC